MLSLHFLDLLSVVEVQVADLLLQLLLLLVQMHQVVLYERLHVEVLLMGRHRVSRLRDIRDWRRVLVHPERLLGLRDRLGLSLRSTWLLGR